MTNDTASRRIDSYTVVELRELDDSAVAGGFGETMEARFARDVLDCERIGVSLQRVQPNRRQPFAHHHGKDEEVYVVVSGSGRAAVDGEVIDLKPWSALRVAPGAVRIFEADDEGLEFLAFGAHTKDDGKMVEPAWPAD